MIYSAAANNHYSPPEMKVIENVKLELPIVLITRLDEYVFNEELLSLKDYVLVDMCEYLWDFELTETHFFGKNTSKFPQFKGEQWERFDKWVKDNPPKLYFKRELLFNDVVDGVVPIDYPCYQNSVNIESKEQFNLRPISVFHFWGRSSEFRVKAHTDFWNQSSKNGASVCDNIYYINDFLQKEENKNKWVSLCIPHYSRMDISYLLQVNGLSKLSLSMKGCGYKCFRHSESPVNSIMVMQDSGLKFAYDWIHGYNCIMYKDDPIPAIEEALKSDDLYEIYLNGLKTIEKYHHKNYTEYIENEIKKVL